MSWIEKNQEKVLLGGAAVVALGLAYLGWSKLASVDTDFSANPKGSGASVTAVPGAELVPKAVQSLNQPREWDQDLDGERPVELFASIPLFVRSDNPDKPIDLLKDEPVHPPIPNTWWLEKRIDPGFGDSPLRDPDGDGFSNIEEFNEKTDPNDPKNFPSLIAKLKYQKDESLGWVIRPSYGSEGKFPFNYEDTKGRKNRVSSAEPIGPDTVFFDKEPQKGRFKLLGHEVVKEMNEKINMEIEITYVRIEDLRSNKTGTIYKFPSPLPDDARKNKYLQYDRTAVFSLEALGQEGKEFKVEENTEFALPPDASEKQYKLLKVTPESVEVEYPAGDGSRKTARISKGSMAVPSE
jgi:hypothetical protein